jgi:hypothetical protein
MLCYQSLHERPQNRANTVVAMRLWEHCHVQHCKLFEVGLPVQPPHFHAQRKKISVRICGSNAATHGFQLSDSDGRSPPYQGKVLQ